MSVGVCKCVGIDSQPHRLLLLFEFGANRLFFLSPQEQGEQARDEKRRKKEVGWKAKREETG